MFFSGCHEHRLRPGQRRRSGRSTARPTSWCTSTSTSCTQLQDQFGAIGDLAAQYIVAHEYGHHVQNVLGVSSEVSRLQQQQTRTRPTSTRSPSSCRPTASPGPGPSAPTSAASSSPGEISEALNAAAAVGDDRIQQQAGQQRQPRQLHPRHVRAARVVVPPRLRHRRPAPVHTFQARSAVATPAGQPPSRRYTHSSRADAEAPVPPRGERRWRRPSTPAAKTSAVSSPVGRIQPEPVDDEVEHERVSDVQRQAHRAGVAQQLGSVPRRRSGSASHVTAPNAHERRAERAGRVHAGRG